MIRQLTADGWECHVAISGPARLAAEYDAAGAVLHVVAMERLTTSGTAGRWVRYLLRWPVSVARLCALARRLHADVIHTNALHSLYGWAVAALVRRPHVWHAREIVVQSSAALRLERLLARRFATVVIAISQAVAAQLEPGNVVEVTDEPDPHEFAPARAGHFRSALGIGDAVPLVGAATRIDTWKGVDVLLDAVPRLRSLVPGVEVVVAGGPVPGKEAYGARLAERAARLGVRWLGPRDDVPQLLADLDVYVQPSTAPEPFGLGIVEALTSGCPVVATAAGGPLEILGAAPPAAGRLVPMGDAEALAGAVAEVLEDGGPSSTDGRRSRPRLRSSGPGDFPSLFAAVAAGGRGYRPPPASSA
jgi:glycosyltransferase involved in cell wall biosynthesis